MRETRLKIREFDELREALEGQSNLLSLIQHNGSVTIYLSDEEKEAVKQAIGDALAAHGVGSDGAINDRGIRLDDLIDKFSIE